MRSVPEFGTAVVIGALLSVVAVVAIGVFWYLVP
jgi:hypothetical protein